MLLIRNQPVPRAGRGQKAGSPPPHTVLPGDTWNFQAWFRDMNPGPTSNFTDGVAVTFR